MQMRLTPSAVSWPVRRDRTHPGTRRAARALVAALALLAPAAWATPGFVVYGRDHTAIIDTNGTAVVVPGLWVMNGAATAVRGVVLPKACSCPSFPAVPDGPAPTVTAEVPAWQESTEGEEECGWALRVPEALVGGTLQLAGEEYNGCEVNLYGFGGTDVPLDGSPVRGPKAPPARSWCTVEQGAPQRVWPPAPSAHCLPRGKEWWPASDDPDDPDDDPDDSERQECQSCGDDVSDSEVQFVRKGFWITIADDVSGAAEWRRVVELRVATPALCPSPEDPCGSPKLFKLGPEVAAVRKALAEGELPDLTKGPDFWVANDGRLALTLASDGAWALLSPGKPPEKRGKLDAKGFAERLGARYHADVDPLVRALGRSLCGKPSACPADPGPAEESETDDERTASELGNACFEALKANELTQAKVLCERALERDPSNRTLGAVRYNLGLIAEKLHRKDDAIRWYEQSLEVRDNATVRKRLEALRRR